MKQTRLRKNPHNIKEKSYSTTSEWTSAQKFAILQHYIKGLSFQEIAEKVGSKKRIVEHWIQDIYEALVDRRETNGLKSVLSKKEKALKVHDAKTLSKSTFKNPKYINEQFLNQLSDWESEVANDAEHAYAYTYAHTGNNIKSLEAANLIYSKRNPTPSSRAMDKMRGIYLREKPVVKNLITAIQQDHLKGLDLNKDYIQTNLVQNIEELKEEVADNPRSRGNLIKSIELLGKSFGAFQDRLVVEEVSPDKALDQMIEMAKANVTLLPAGSETDETWVEDGS